MPVTPSQLSKIMAFAAILMALPLQLHAQSLYTDDRVEQGDAVQVFVYPVKGDEEVLFMLVNEEGKTLSTSKAFLFNYEKGVLAQSMDNRSQDWVQIALIGIPADGKTGNYSIRAQIKEGSKSKRIERPIRVMEKDYPKQTIKLSPKMDSILRDPDPVLNARKTKEANQLWAIIKKIDSKDLYYDQVLLRPIREGSGWTSSAYGFVRRYEYPDGTSSNSVHNGYDIAAKGGEEVLASGDGVVVMAQDRVVTGKTVMLALLPGVYAKYQHLSAINVKVGELVKTGDVIGEVGKTGFATGNHLHMELWISGRHVDPSNFFDKPLINTNAIASMLK